MFNTHKFQKYVKWIFLLMNFMFKYNTTAHLSESLLTAKKMDLQLMRWFSKSVDSFSFDPYLINTVLEKYGYRGKALLPTFSTISGNNYLHHTSGYHLFILHKATTLTNASPGLALLQIKFVAFMHAINYMNCVIYTTHYSMPNIRYCRELALAFFDLSVMGTDILCHQIAQFFEPDDIRNILINTSKMIYEFETEYRLPLEKVQLTDQKSNNQTEILREYAATPSDYYPRLIEAQTHLLSATYKELNDFIEHQKNVEFNKIDGMCPKVKKNLFSMKYAIQHKLKIAMETWLQAEIVYTNSLYPQGGLDWMKALHSAEIEIIIQLRMWDEDTINQLKHIQEENFQIDENVTYNKIIITPVKKIQKI